MKKNQSYRNWKKELQIWEATNEVLGVEGKVQAGTLFESLKGMPRQTVLSEMDVTDIIADKGVTNIINILDHFFMGNKIQFAYNAINELMSFKRESGVTVEQFIVEFKLQVNRVKALKLIKIKSQYNTSFFLMCKKYKK